MDNISFDTIMAEMATAINGKDILDPDKWLNWGLKLSVVIEMYEEPKRIELEHQIALSEVVMKELYPEMSGKDIDRKTKTTQLWKDLQHQKSKIEMADKLIMIAKKNAQFASDEMRRNTL